MTNENYKKACEIQKEIDMLTGHLSDLNKAKISESTGFGFTYRFNDHHPEVKLLSSFIPALFPMEYVNKVKDRIENLKMDFEAL